mgnify:CR=1 FL=1
MNLTIKELGDNQIWFSSDYHFGHANIIKYCNRPFKDTDEMNNTIIERHNEIVKPEDTVICLGDVSFHHGVEWISKMNGKFICIKGNHDDTEYKRNACARLTITYEKYKFLCCHRPDNVFGNFTLNIVGHVHEKWLYREHNHMLNVGVDVHDFYPVSLKEIIKFCH